MELTQEYVDYLDDLRDSGETNMWGAAPYLEDEFGLDSKEAEEILFAWIEAKEEGS